MFNIEVCMKAFAALVIGLLSFFPAAAQNRAGGSQALGADVSGALSQMGGTLAAADDDVFPQDAYFLAGLWRRTSLAGTGPGCKNRRPPGT
jgi:hypothetical protein